MVLMSSLSSAITTHEPCRWWPMALQICTAAHLCPWVAKSPASLAPSTRATPRPVNIESIEEPEFHTHSRSPSRPAHHAHPNHSQPVSHRCLWNWNPSTHSPKPSPWQPSTPSVPCYWGHPPRWACASAARFHPSCGR